MPGGTARVGARRPEPGERLDSPFVDALASPEESPLDEVPLDPFFISKWEMTHEQWNRAVGRPPDGRRPVTLPATLLDWFAATSVLARVGLELPTEVQWEYSARAGTTTPWWTGADPATLARFEVFDAPRALSVGGAAPNGFGLYDVAGNVSEWCRDVFARYEDARTAGDGERSGLDERSHRMRRGGSYRTPAEQLRSARRQIESPYGRRTDVWVRPARRLER